MPSIPFLELTQSVDPGQTPQNMASDHGLHCLLTRISTKNKNEKIHQTPPKIGNGLVQLIAMEDTKQIWATAWQNQQNGMCAQRRLKISLSICSVWSESLLSAWSKLGSLAIHWAHCEDSDQTGRMPRLIWVFTGRTVMLLVLSWGGSFVNGYEL